MSMLKEISNLKDIGPAAAPALRLAQGHLARPGYRGGGILSGLGTAIYANGNDDLVCHLPRPT
jgi:hypothetical protein